MLANVDTSAWCSTHCSVLCAQISTNCYLALQKQFISSCDGILRFVHCSIIWYIIVWSLCISIWCSSYAAWWFRHWYLVFILRCIEVQKLVPGAHYYIIHVVETLFISSFYGASQYFKHQMFVFPFKYYKYTKY